MKTLFTTVLIGVLAIGFLLAASPGKAEAWFRPGVAFSVVVPPFGLSIGAPAPYYYPGPVYVAPPYPVYERAYPYYGYYGYYGYGPYYRYRHWDHRGWRGERHDRGHDRGHERGHWR